MDITVWKVKENKCPRCGKIGIYWNNEREIINLWGIKIVRNIATYQCVDESHEQEIFAVISERKATPFDLARW